MFAHQENDPITTEFEALIASANVRALISAGKLSRDKLHDLVFTKLPNYRLSIPKEDVNELPLVTIIKFVKYVFANPQSVTPCYDEQESLRGSDICDCIEKTFEFESTLIDDGGLITTNPQFLQHFKFQGLYFTFQRCLSETLDQVHSERRRHQHN